MNFSCVVWQRSFSFYIKHCLWEEGTLRNSIGRWSLLNLLHWSLLVHPAKFSPSQALSARSTWPNYIQSEGKDSPLWSTQDHQPSSCWLVWHLRLLSARYFSRTAVFECCLKSQNSVCKRSCSIYVYTCTRAWNIRRAVCNLRSKLWPLFFLKKDRPWWAGNEEDWARMQIKGQDVYYKMGNWG